MIITGIDPGPDLSTFVDFDGQCVLACSECTNREMAKRVDSWSASTSPVYCEDFMPYGVRLGHESIATIKAIGVFQYCGAILLPRPDIKLALCGVKNAKDADVRDTLLHRFGGKAAAVGTRKQPGPLYGVSGHAWAALAVAVVAWDRLHQEAKT